MPRRPSVQPTKVELEILHLLWQHGPCPLGTIHDAVSASSDRAYSTTRKMIQVMRKKGLVTCDETSRPQLYAAAASKEQTQLNLLEDLAERVFEGEHEETGDESALGRSRHDGRSPRDAATRAESERRKAMTFLSHILSAAPAERIGWTLLHSLWQFALLAALLAGALELLRRRSANLRYLVGCLALAAMLAAGATTFCLLPAAAPPTASVPSPATDVFAHRSWQRGQSHFH